MAKLTDRIVVGADAWVALSAGEDTVLVSLGGSDSVYLAVAGAPGDLAADDTGHILRSTGLPSASFGGLGANNVYARAYGDATYVYVTAY